MGARAKGEARQADNAPPRLRHDKERNDNSARKELGLVRRCLPLRKSAVAPGTVSFSDVELQESSGCTPYPL